MLTKEVVLSITDSNDHYELNDVITGLHENHPKDFKLNRFRRHYLSIFFLLFSAGMLVFVFRLLGILFWHTII